jgi:hypothetical protein
MKRIEHLRWAIVGGGHALSWAWFQWSPLHTTGCAYPALWMTRQEARNALPEARGPTNEGKYPDAHVVRVWVIVEEV